MRGRGCSGAEPARGSQREGAGDPEAEPGFLHAPFVRSTAACGPGVARTFISALPGPGGRAAGRPGTRARLEHRAAQQTRGGGSGSAAVSMD